MYWFVMAPYFSPPFLGVARQLLSLWYIIYFNVPWNDWSPNKQVCMFSRSQSEHTCGFGPLQTDLGGAHSHLEIRVFFWGLKVWICLRWLLKLSTMGFIIIEPPFCFFPTTLSKSKVREEITRSLSWCWSWMFFLSVLFYRFDPLGFIIMKPTTISGRKWLVHFFEASNFQQILERTIISHFQ